MHSSSHLHPSHAYAYVYFDLGNVLVHFDHSRAVAQAAELTGLTVGQMREHLFDSGLEDRYETGLLTSDEYVEEVSRIVGKRLDKEAFLRAVSDIFWVNEGILSILRTLKGAGVRLGLLSNTCEAHWNWIVGRQYETVVGWFEHHVLSYEIRAMKPDLTIYRRATEIASVDAEGILFIDDRLENVEGARRAGWTAIQYKDSLSLSNWFATEKTIAES